MIDNKAGEFWSVVVIALEFTTQPGQCHRIDTAADGKADVPFPPCTILP
jgi:hypothetical protein